MHEQKSLASGNFQRLCVGLLKRQTSHHSAHGRLQRNGVKTSTGRLVGLQRSEGKEITVQHAWRTQIIDLQWQVDWCSFAVREACEEVGGLNEANQDRRHIQVCPLGVEVRENCAATSAKTTK